jgi:hypothetical protein
MQGLRFRVRDLPLALPEVQSSTDTSVAVDMRGPGVSVGRLVLPGFGLQGWEEIAVTG